MENKKLNELVTRYQKERTDEVFSELYEMVSKNWRNLDAVGKSILSNGPEMLAVYEDALMECVEVYDDSSGNFINLLNRYIWRKRNDIYKVNKARKKYHAIMPDTEHSEAATFELADEFNLEHEAIRKTDQRQLIGFLLNGEDELTTAIVKATFENPNLGPTAIGRKLGLKHHSTVTRTYKRLAAKFDAKHPGEYTDYLVAL